MEAIVRIDEYCHSEWSDRQEIQKEKQIFSRMEDTLDMTIQNIISSCETCSHITQSEKIIVNVIIKVMIMS